MSDKPTAESLTEGCNAFFSEDGAVLCCTAFVCVMVEPDGSTVIAGNALPGAKVEILNGNEVISSQTVDGTGDFAAVLDQPLAPGDHSLQIRATAPDGNVVTSEEVATISVPEGGKGELLAMVVIGGTVLIPGTGHFSESWAVQTEALGRRLKIRIHVRSFDAMCRMVQAGLGLTLLPDGVLAPQVAAACGDEYTMENVALIGERIWPTVLLLGTAIVIASIVGIWIGIRAGWKPGSRLDKVSTGTTLRENGLVETSVILDISARLIVNRTALKTDRRVAALVDAFRREADASLTEAAAYIRDILQAWDSIAPR